MKNKINIKIINTTIKGLLGQQFLKKILSILNEKFIRRDNMITLCTTLGRSYAGNSSIYFDILIGSLQSTRSK